MNVRKLPAYAPGKSGSIAAICSEFLASCQDRQVAPESLRRYDTAFRQFCSVQIENPRGELVTFGEYRAADLGGKSVSRAVGKLTEAFGPKVACFALAMVSSAYKHALNCDEVSGMNWFAIAKRPKKGNVRKVSWQKEEILAVFDAAERLHKPVVTAALRLAELIAQRPVDVLKLTGSNYNRDDKYLRFFTGKTHQSLEISLAEHPALRRIFEALSPEQPWLVDAELGVVDTPLKFRKLFATVRDAAGVRSDLWFADIRRTKISQLAEDGASEDEILSLSKHKNRNQLRFYITHTVGQTNRAVSRLARHTVAPQE